MKKNNMIPVFLNIQSNYHMDFIKNMLNINYNPDTYNDLYENKEWAINHIINMIYNISNIINNSHAYNVRDGNNMYVQDVSDSITYKRILINGNSIIIVDSKLNDTEDCSFNCVAILLETSKGFHIQKLGVVEENVIFHKYRNFKATISLDKNPGCYDDINIRHYITNLTCKLYKIHSNTAINPLVDDIDKFIKIALSIKDNKSAKSYINTINNKLKEYNMILRTEPAFGDCYYTDDKIAIKIISNNGKCFNTILLFDNKKIYSAICNDTFIKCKKDNPYIKNIPIDSEKFTRITIAIYGGDEELQSICNSIGKLKDLRYISSFDNILEEILRMHKYILFEEKHYDFYAYNGCNTVFDSAKSDEYSIQKMNEYTENMKKCGIFFDIKLKCTCKGAKTILYKIKPCRGGIK